MIKRDTLSATAAVGGKAINGKGEFINFATDSRAVEKGDMFICIRGERTDGHKYVSGAIERGAGAILCEEEVTDKVPCILVDNSVKALQKLASVYRESLSVLTVGITGSVGKTTTKEFTYAVLSSRYSTHKTEGNKNSETGLAITILGVDPEDGACVAEMGMSGLGEISELTRIARPHIAVVTNVGYSHIEHLKTRENIRKAKLEIIEGLDPDGTLILNGDDDMLSSCRDVFPNTLFFGIENPACDVRATHITETENTTSYTVNTKSGSFSVTRPVKGRHYIYDSLAAVAVGLIAGLTETEIRDGLLAFERVGGRQNVYVQKGVTVIDDTYNAVPCLLPSLPADAAMW